MDYYHFSRNSRIMGSSLQAPLVAKLMESTPPAEGGQMTLPGVVACREPAAKAV